MPTLLCYPLPILQHGTRNLSYLGSSNEFYCLFPQAVYLQPSPPNTTYETRLPRTKFTLNQSSCFDFLGKLFCFTSSQFSYLQSGIIMLVIISQNCSKNKCVSAYETLRRISSKHQVLLIIAVSSNHCQQEAHHHSGLHLTESISTEGILSGMGCVT